MAGSERNLGAKKDAAIIALLSARSIEEAARTANVPPRTLYRWLKEPEFDAEYRRAKRAAYGQAIARLHQATSAAATTLIKTMIDGATPASVKVRASEAILNHTAKAVEIEEIEARVKALEQAAAGSVTKR
jgi:hypothetical protein